MKIQNAAWRVVGQNEKWTMDAVVNVRICANDFDQIWVKCEDLLPKT